MTRSGSGMPWVSRAAPRFHVDARRDRASLLHPLGKGPHGADDFLAPAIVEGDHEGQARYCRAVRFSASSSSSADVGGQPLPLADDADADVVGVELGEIVPDEALQQAHQVGDLLGRTAPVLGREAVDGQVADAEIAGGAHGAADRLDAAPMALEPRQPALGRPAAVAVHDDGDMRRDRPRLPTCRPGRGADSLASPLMIAFRCTARIRPA